MKLRVSKKQKIATISGIGLLIIIISVILYKTIKYPVIKEQKNTLYTYKNSGVVDYKVLLKPNVLYGENAVLYEGNVFIAELIDTIKLNFKYSFEGERAADIKGDYEISAIVEGFDGNDKEQKVIWRKLFPLLKKESFEIKDKTVAFEKEISISYPDYEKFAKTVLESTKVSSQVRMTIAMNVNLKAATDKGIIEKRVIPSLRIPLASNYFEIIKTQSQAKTEAIEETVKLKVPISKVTIALYIALILVFAAVLTFIIFFVEIGSDYSPMEKEIKKIIKNYSERMIAFDDHISFNCQNYYKVYSIEDLIKLSDEISRPIMYKFNSDVNQIYEFFVFDDESIYTFDVRLKISEVSPKLLDIQKGIEA